MKGGSAGGARRALCVSQNVTEGCRSDWYCQHWYWMPRGSHWYCQHWYYWYWKPMGSQAHWYRKPKGAPLILLALALSVLEAQGVPHWKPRGAHWYCQHSYYWYWKPRGFHRQAQWVPVASLGGPTSRTRWSHRQGIPQGGPQKEALWGPTGEPRGSYTQAQGTSSTSSTSSSTSNDKMKQVFFLAGACFVTLTQARPTMTPYH